MALKAITLAIRNTDQKDADELDAALNEGYTVASAVVIDSSEGRAISYILHKKSTTYAFTGVNREALMYGAPKSSAYMQVSVKDGD